MRISASGSKTAVCFAALLLMFGEGCSRSSPGVAATKSSAAQTTADPLEIPAGAEGALIWRGKVIFDHTPDQAKPWAGNALSCSDCHLKSGTQAFGSPMYGAAKDYPSFSGRAGRVITLPERLQECFVRSENGQPPPEDSEVSKALVAYIDWLSRDALKDRAATGRGYGDMPVLAGNAHRGLLLYAAKCAGCHGREGVPNPPTLSPLWGPQSWNDGAGMNIPAVLAKFLLRNMPADKPGTLSPQDAMDVAAWVDSRPRPKFNQAYRNY
jgi:thiosulfate dehydrogenase